MTKASAEDLLSGLAANFRAFDFTWLSIERVDLTNGFEKDVCLSCGERSEPHLYQDKHTSYNQMANLLLKIRNIKALFAVRF